MWGLREIGKRAIKVLNAKNDDEVSFVDVKALYDEAYEEKARAKVNLKRFKVLLAKAQKLDEIYRAQLAQQKTFKYGRAA